VSHSGLSTFLAVAMMGLATGGPPVGTLESQLRQEPLETLARDARRQGDARRGAVVFHQPSLTCAKCHIDETGAPALGPDLSLPEKGRGEEHLIESILDPSKTIKKGFETVTISIDDGRIVSGLLAEDRPDAVVIRDPGQDGKAITIRKDRIVERRDGGASIMPAGLVDNLATRQQFLDLIRYLMEIAEKGPARARELRPEPGLYAQPPLPDSERDIDHAGLLSGLDEQSLKRGETIYQRVCMNCHGTVDRPGSLPTSLRFASGSFKNGSDPFSMYRTLTLGFGQMTAQTWMVPRQKYDVIHYLREAFLKPHNPSAYVRVDQSYLAGLPRGQSRGPEPVEIQPWATMDYGPSLMATYEVSGGDRSNLVYKGIAVRLDPGPGGISRGRSWALYDQDTLRFAAFWMGQGFIDWNGINFNGQHQVHPRIAGTVVLANPNELGWANPYTGSFNASLRERTREGNVVGPLPRRWVHYRGIYKHGDRVILSYSVGRAEVLETAGLEINSTWKNHPVFTRTLNIGKSPHDLRVRVAPADPGIAVAMAGAQPGPARLHTRYDFTFLNIPASVTPLAIKLLISKGDPPVAVRAYARLSQPAESLEPFTKGGPARWPERLVTRAKIGRDEGPFAVDVLTVPEANPWLCQLRLSGFDFLADGRRAAVCTWDGDVWLVEGVDHPEKGLSWRRIASGLFQPLGLKVVDDVIYVSCRDQIVRLRNLNGDGEIDFYENFNNDHQVTEHFHEFAMGLQTDADGNFYYAKAARHGLPALVTHHGTLLRVSKDGAHTDILATGFRAPNGICLNADGTFFLTDQEGFWTPKNRINWVKRGGFYGNLWSYTSVTDPSDSAMEQPVCWLTNAFDRSPAELLWVDSKNPAWKPLLGSLLCLSYGYGKIFVVPHEIVGGQMQGGECALPIPRFPTGLIRGRFHPGDGQLYTCGLYAWAGDQTQPGGFYRVRATGKPMFLPIGLGACREGLTLSFTDRLDPKIAADSSRYSVKTWTIKRKIDYGSDHFDERTVGIASARLISDGRTVLLEMPQIRPTRCMEVVYHLQGQGGEPIDGVINNTIHVLRDRRPQSAELFPFRRSPTHGSH
jgi:putative heme-binding domain-containing protein